MRNFLRLLTVSISILAMLGAFGCSDRSSDPVIPQNEDAEVLIAQAMQNSSDGRVALGVYHVTMNRVTESVELTPNRDSQVHCDISEFMQKYMQITWEMYLHDQALWVFNLEITNPTPLTGYDLRVVFIPNPYSGDYIGNADDYTHRWNCMSEEWVNGFKSYCKDDPDRAFLPGHSDTQQFWIYENTPPGQVLEFDLVVEVSYPDQCEEPYEISGQYTTSPITHYYPAIVFVNIYQHQGIPTRVTLDTTTITGYVTDMEHCGGPLWTCTVTNVMHLSSGTYRCKIMADSYYGSDQDYLDGQLYDFVDIVIDY